jgi:hypothetical protein
MTVFVPELKLWWVPGLFFWARTCSMASSGNPFLCRNSMFGEYLFPFILSRQWEIRLYREFVSIHKTLWLGLNNMIYCPSGLQVFCLTPTLAVSKKKFCINFYRVHCTRVIKFFIEFFTNIVFFCQKWKVYFRRSCGPNDCV